jgi:voltage-gated potassium channel
MAAFLFLLIRFFRGIIAGLKDPEFRALFVWVLGVVGLGTFFYSRVEGWRPLDAFYFTVITLATVGYGDFTPQTDAGKLFTVFYIIVGISLLSGFILLVSERSRKLRRSRLSARKKR